MFPFLLLFMDFIVPSPLPVDFFLGEVCLIPFRCSCSCYLLGGCFCQLSPDILVIILLDLLTFDVNLALLGNFYQDDHIHG